jgi:uncharacterized protein YlxW (UPF0749 family)
MSSQLEKLTQADCGADTTTHTSAKMTSLPGNNSETELIQNTILFFMGLYVVMNLLHLSFNSGKEALKNEFTTLQTMIETLQTSVNTLQTTVEDLQTAVDDLDDLKDDIKWIKTDLNFLCSEANITFRAATADKRLRLTKI